MEASSHDLRCCVYYTSLVEIVNKKRTRLVKDGSKGVEMSRDNKPKACLNDTTKLYLERVKRARHELKFTFKKEKSRL